MTVVYFYTRVKTGDLRQREDHTKIQQRFPHIVHLEQKKKRKKRVASNVKNARSLGELSFEFVSQRRTNNRITRRLFFQSSGRPALMLFFAPFLGHARKFRRHRSPSSAKIPERKIVTGKRPFSRKLSSGYSLSAFPLFCLPACLSVAFVVHRNTANVIFLHFVKLLQSTSSSTQLRDYFGHVMPIDLCD